MLLELQQQFPLHLASLPGATIDWLPAARQAAFTAFMQHGLPTTRIEAWKYTNLLMLGKSSYSFAEVNTTAIVLPPPLTSGTRLVFVDGYFRPELSTLKKNTENFQLDSLALAIKQANPALLAHWKKYLPLQDTPFAALNLSGAADGAFIVLPAECQASTIELCFYGANSVAKKLIQPRNIILAGVGSTATIIEHYCGDNTAANLTNSVTELFLADRAHIQHIKLQTEPAKSVHIAQLYVKQAAYSVMQSYVLSYGGSLVRNEVRNLLSAPNSTTELYGLFIAKDYQHMDQHTTIEHCQPHCTSHEFYRGILFDQARGVFSGNVLVQPLAAKTKAKQINNNLLLSPKAEIDTKPELQIYTDDVQCSHGATVGKLDEQALFYLRARGLGYAQAKTLLTYTFAAEILQNLPDDNLRNILQQQILAYLPATAATVQEICHAY